jgi:hypothetical protein
MHKVVFAVIVVCIIIILVLLFNRQDVKTCTRAEKSSSPAQNLNELSLIDMDGARSLSIYNIDKETPAYDIILVSSPESSFHNLCRIFEYVEKTYQADQNAAVARINFKRIAATPEMGLALPAVIKMSSDNVIELYDGYTNYGQFVDWVQLRPRRLVTTTKIAQS